MSNTGGALEWIAQCLGDGAAYEKLLEAAASAPPGSARLIFLPYLNGERSPVWDPFARGVFCGLTLRTRRSHLVRAVLEAALRAEQNLEIAEEILGRPVSEVRIMGGAARSGVWNAIRANVLQKPLRMVPVRETRCSGRPCSPPSQRSDEEPQDAMRRMQAAPSRPPAPIRRRERSTTPPIAHIFASTRPPYIFRESASRMTASKS